MAPEQVWVLVVGILLILAVAVGMAIHAFLSRMHAIAGLPKRAVRKISGILHPTPMISLDPVTVVREIRSLARLEMVQYTVEKILSASSRQGPFGFLFGDKLLLVAHGTVIAGIDLSKFDSGDIRIDAQGKMSIVIPEAEIFTVTLDNDKSYVYHRETGLLAGGTKDLESEARKAAQAEILKAALEDGILATALTNGKTYLQRFLNSIGLRNLVFSDALPELADPTLPPNRRLSQASVKNTSQDQSSSK
jgi:hypothetical protein